MTWFVLSAVLMVATALYLPVGAVFSPAGATCQKRT
jgi:hypothetical protein